MYVNIDVATLQLGVDNNQQPGRAANLEQNAEPDMDDVQQPGHVADLEQDAEPDSPASITAEDRLEYLRKLSNLPEFFAIFQYVKATPVSNPVSF
jgi:hypothetical protein